MRSRNDSNGQAGPCHKPCACILTGLLLSFTLGHVSFAATDNYVDCDRLAADLRSLDVPSTELPLAVERAADGNADDLTAVRDEDLARSDVIAPVLLLTPRVATILRKVFDTELQQVDEEDAPATRTDKPRAATPPLVNAPSAAMPEDPLASENGTDANANQYVPRFQRQMYRTDI